MTVTRELPVMPGDELPDDDYLTWTCLLPGPWGRECGLWTQGGRRGLALHQATVHPEHERTLR